MRELPDLTTVPCEELLGLIAAQQQTSTQQQATIDILAKRVADLERRLGSNGGKGVPATKPTPQTHSRASGKPRKQRARGSSRQRSPTPTRVIARVSDSATPLTGGW